MYKRQFMIFEVANGCFGYGSGNEILRNLNFRVPEGKILSVLGPNGVGKTTPVSYTHLLCLPGLRRSKVRLASPLPDRPASAFASPGMFFNLPPAAEFALRDCAGLLIAGPISFPLHTPHFAHRLTILPLRRFRRKPFAAGFRIMIFFDGFHGLPGRIHNRKYAERFLFGEFLRYHFFKHGKQFVEKTVRIQNYDGFFMLFQLLERNNFAQLFKGCLLYTSRCV